MSRNKSGKKVKLKKAPYFRDGERYTNKSAWKNKKTGRRKAAK